MTQLLRELKLRKRDEQLRTAAVQPNGKPKEGSDAYREKMKNHMNSRVRPVLEEHKLTDHLRAEEIGATKCFLCANIIYSEEATVETALGRVHVDCAYDDDMSDDDGDDQ